MPNIRRGNLRCYKCERKHGLDYLRSGSGADLKWKNVVIVERKPDNGYGTRFVCKCRNCGYIYTSRAGACWRQWARQDKQPSL
jgi:hypothetical protein